MSSSGTLENLEYRAYMFEEIIIVALPVFPVTNFV